ncbi:MAG: 30S ribosomal protein S20 [bacterium]
MANIKSAKKRILVTNKKTMRNKAIKSSVKTSIKKVVVAVKEGNKEQAQVALKGAVRSIDKACTKGIFHKNTASRKKSRLTKAVNKI